MASHRESPAFIKAVEEAAQSLKINPALLAANPTLLAYLEQIVEAQFMAADPPAAPAATSDAAPAAAVIASTPPTTSSPLPPPSSTPVSEIATLALATPPAPPSLPIDATAIISTVIGSLAMDTTPQIAPLPVSATLTESQPAIPAVPLSSALLLTPLHKATDSHQSSSPSEPKRQSQEFTLSSSSATPPPPPPKPEPTRRVTRTGGKRKLTDQSASSKKQTRKRGRQSSKALELFPEEEKLSGPSLPKCNNKFDKREVIPPLIVPQELWNTLSRKEFEVAPVVSALERTGWFKLADEPCAYDPDQIRTFYSAITVVGSPPNYDYAALTWLGKAFVLDAELIASILDLPTGEGFCDLQKKSGPLAEFCIRKRMKSPNSDKPLPLHQFSFPDQLLHQIIVRNVVPRLDKHELLDNLDQNLLGHVFAGAQIDTPRVILRHMLLSCKSRNHDLPYPALIKTIMERNGMYRPSQEITADECLSVAMLRHLKHKNTLTISPTPSPEPSPPRLRHKPESRSTQPAISKTPPTYETLPYPADLQQALFQQTAVNVKILQLLEEISLRIAHHHRMSKDQLSHIRVLLAGPEPSPLTARNLHDTARMDISSDDGKDLADSAKDTAAAATGVATEEQKDDVDSEDVAQQK